MSAMPWIKPVRNALWAAALALVFARDGKTLASGHRDNSVRLWDLSTKQGASLQGHKANAHALARYAAICQEAGLVPIVEPEVLMDGDHTIDRCEEVTEWTLNAVYDALYLNKVVLEHSVLKPSMVISGKKCAQQASV